MHKSYDEIVSEYSKYATAEDMEELSEITSEYIDHPYDKEQFLMRVEKLLKPFLCEETAHEYVAEFRNADGSTGEHWSYEVIMSTCDKLGISRMSDRYNSWDLYAAVNMMYSDLYDPSKPSEMYVKDGHKFLADKDFPRPGKMKWYLASKERLEEK
jgi:hypothetical protein